MEFVRLICQTYVVQFLWQPWDSAVVHLYAVGGGIRAVVVLLVMYCEMATCMYATNGIFIS